MNCSFVEEFIKTGVFREYPAVFFAEPVSREDRRELGAGDPFYRSGENIYKMVRSRSKVLHMGLFRPGRASEKHEVLSYAELA